MITLPHGYFFRIGTGSWRITIYKDSILHFDSSTSKLTSYNFSSNEWNNLRPPIQGTNNLVISKYGDALTMLKSFVSNTKGISKEEVETLIQTNVKK